MSASKDYAMVDWAVRIIVGGLIETALLSLFNETIVNNSQYVLGPLGYGDEWSQPPLLWGVLGLIAIIFVAPFFLSLLLTKKDVELENLRLVAPFQIAVVSSAFAGVFFSATPYFTHLKSISPGPYILGLLGLLLLALVSRGEDTVAVAILGRSADREAIFFEKLRIHAPIEEVRSKLATPEYADNLFLKMNVEGDKERGYVLKTQRGFDFTTKIGLYVDEDKDFTILKLGYYQKDAYSLRLTKYFIEEAKRQSIYLHDILADREPPMKFEVLVPLSNTGHDLFVKEIIEELRGFYVATKKAPRVSVFLVATLITLAGLTVALATLGLPEDAIVVSGSVDFMVLVVTVMDYVRNKR